LSPRRKTHDAIPKTHQIRAIKRQDPKKPGGEAIYRITGTPGEA